MNLYLFSIDCVPGLQYIVRCTVFDKIDRVVLEGSSFPLSTRLVAGTYTIRLDVNGLIDDKEIVLKADCRYQIATEEKPGDSPIVLVAPKLYSSAPLDESLYGSTRHYYSAAARKFATEYTYRSPKEKADGSLFLFLRYFSQEKYQEIREKGADLRVEDLQLVDHLGNIEFDFSRGRGFHYDEVDGWMAFNTYLPSGLYFLVYRRGEGRQVPVYVLDGLHTQVFLLIDERPLFSSLRIFLRHGRVFEPGNKLWIYTDFLVSKLHNRDFFIEKGLEEAIASGDLATFMTDLLCGYFAVMNKREVDVPLVRRLLGRLPGRQKWFAGVLPDVHAIAIAAGLDREFKEPVKGVPMMNAGFSIIRNAAMSRDELIREGSMADLIIEPIVYDSPFTTCKPFEIQEDEFNEVKVNRWSLKDIYEGNNRLVRARDLIRKYFLPGSKDDVKARAVPTDDDQIVEDRLWYDFLETELPRNASWLEFLFQDLARRRSSGDDTDSLHLRWFSQELRVPLVTIRRIYKKIRNDRCQETLTSTAGTHLPQTYIAERQKQLDAIYNED